MAIDDLSDAVDKLRYSVARPGTFSTFYPETTDDMLLAVLIDGAAEAQLEGVFLTYDIDEDGIITPAMTNGQAAVIVLFAAVRFLRAELINRNTSVTYEAGSAHYETTQATNILRDILKGLEASKGRVMASIGESGGSLAGGAAAFFMADQYLARLWDSGPVAVGW